MKDSKSVLEAFTPKTKLTPGQTQRMAKINKAYQDLAVELVELAPENADRTSALRKLLDSKMTAVQSITHGISPEDALLTKKA
jgi:N-acetylglucosamine-6-phosphate deacetylase